ncbi:MAG: 3'(2'),5'-bisphosphate nucleotidase [Planctomycetes bacterium]|nr:3'(2'),5'-bisphosphate nucleotidase [Planctomycetota bacterium]
MSTEGANYERERAAAVEAVAEAALLCQRVQARKVAGAALTKGDKSPVTIADFGSQALVCRTLARHFPHDAVMGEEGSAELREAGHAALAREVCDEVRVQASGASDAEVLGWIDRAQSEGGHGRFWCLDPIDGTKGFLRGEQYAVALALIDRGVVEVGALACPNLAVGSAPGCLLIAVRGKGVQLLPLGANGPGAPQPVRASSCRERTTARIVESVEAAHGDHGGHERVRAALGCAAPPVRLDSQAKYAVLARGDGEIYLRLPTSADYRENLWDQAAGVRVIEEAGGRVTDCDGRPLDFTTGRKLTRNQGIVATNGLLHEAVIAAIRSIRAP